MRLELHPIHLVGLGYRGDKVWNYNMRFGRLDELKRRHGNVCDFHVRMRIRAKGKSIGRSVRLNDALFPNDLRYHCVQSARKRKVYRDASRFIRTRAATCESRTTDHDALMTFQLWEKRPFSTFTALLDAAQSVIDTELTHTDRLVVIQAHPLLGAPPAELSALSLKEQGYQAGPANPDAAVNAELMRLNGAYETKYGFPCVIFVNGRPRKDLIPVMQSRIARDISADEELHFGLCEMVAIARDRLRKLQSQQ
jgi:2-oxo-4-hydroxy-4-carboxy--5-ureidoimidazoline (OHCU) decarboxylase